jgi:hypothetical protein
LSGVRQRGVETATRLQPKEGNMCRIRPRSAYDVIALVSLFLVIGGGTALASFVVSSNSQIGPNTVSGHKPPTGNHANIIKGSINSQDLTTSSVGSPQLKLGAVNQLALHSGAVTSPKIAGGAVNTTQIGKIPQARVEFTAAQSITNNIDTVLSFDVARYDNDGLFGIPHNRLTAPVAGVYAITAGVNWEVSGSGDDRSIGICKNDTGAVCPGVPSGLALASDTRTPSATDGAQSISTQAKLNAGDFIDVGVFQNSGGTLHAEASPWTNLTMTWVGKG